MNDHLDGQIIKVSAIIISLAFLKSDFNMDLASLGIIIDFHERTQQIAHCFKNDAIFVDFAKVQRDFFILLIKYILQ